MTDAIPEPSAGLTMLANAVTALGHLLMLGITLYFFPDRKHRTAAWLVVGFLGLGAVMHIVASLWVISAARWVMIVRAAGKPFIVAGWFLLMRSARRNADRVQVVEGELTAACHGPNTQRMIDARVLMEKIAGLPS